MLIYAPMIIASTQAQHFTTFLPLFSIGFGLCNGLTYMVPMQHGWLWFPERPGLVSGIIIGGFGIGTLVFGLVCSHIVNPDGEDAVDGKFTPEVNDRVPKMQLILAISNIVLAIVAILLIFPGPDPSSVKTVQENLEKQLAIRSNSENSPLIYSSK